MRRPVGLDLDGWHDHACRDWDPEEPDAPPCEPVVLDGGIRSVVVEHEKRRIGGPEAILSPIGRGGGWGPVGEPSRRRLLADHWSRLGREDPDDHLDGDMHAAAEALSHAATHQVVCIPDDGGFREQHQKRLLQSLGRAATQPVLVWRSVALVLGLLETGELGDLHDGMRIACLIHGSEGIERQVLVLRALREHPEQFAPERAGPGEVVCPGLSLTASLARAHRTVAAANTAWDEARTGPSRLAANLLFDDKPPDAGEIMRAPNADWLRLRAPATAPLLGEPEPNPGWPTNIACTIVLSPLARRHTDALQAALSLPASAGHVVFAKPWTAAKGALFAARRMEAGIPHYLDRLDPMAMAVLRGSTPIFEELTPAHTTVAGNREYVSRPLTGFRWAPGLATATFYVRKGGSEIRRWSVTLDVAPGREERLTVQLRQTPAQGWATLFLSSDTWDVLRRVPIRLEWDKLVPEERSAQQILKELRGPPPVVPQRIHYAAAAGLWDGSLRKHGLSAALRRFAAKRPGSLAEMKDIVSLRWTPPPPLHLPFQKAGPLYPVSTDGTLPKDIDGETEDAFRRATVEIASDLLQRVRDPALQVDSNEALLFLTWIFAACPTEVRSEVIKAFHAMLNGNDHKLLHPRGAKQAVVHGLARIVSDHHTLETLLPWLLGRLPDPQVLAPVSAMLSRPEATPDILNGPGIDLEGAIDGLREVFAGLLKEGAFKQRYQYAQQALFGLLRVRERKPWALMAGSSPAALKMAEVLQHAVEHLEKNIKAPRHSAPERRNLERKLETTKQCVQFLTTTTGRPDILSLIDEDD